MKIKQSNELIQHSRFWIRIEKLLGRRLSGYEVNDWRQKLGLDVMEGCYELKDVTPGTPNETLETAGCTGGCECYDSDGLPDCRRCTQKEVKNNNESTATEV